MEKGRLAAALTIAVCLGGLFVLLSSGIVTKDTAKSTTVSTASPAQPSAPPKRDWTSTPLPPQGTPLRSVFADLRRRAEMGDPRAACRLAAESQRCENLHEQVASYDEQLWKLKQAGRTASASARAGLSSNETALEAIGDSLLNQVKDCEGAPQLSSAERVALWRQGALAGQPAALANYSVGNAFKFRELLEVAPQLERYRREAEGMALQAAAKGDLRTSLVLAAAYSPRRDSGDRVFLAQVVKPDISRSLALYRRGGQLLPAKSPAQTRSVIDDNIAWLQQRASPAELARADALTGQWSREWSSVVANTPTELIVEADGGVASMGPARCSQ
ncbi:hypothetical protein FHY12_003832 [Xanthomonas arboricola]|uniref:hypothetical protein n=1 Tax=Xanthomonas euroxanthea TaxID=2259622 RepID=UPI00141B9165|nr:hypothetical protein [Xanthomonas euroxanthea]NIK41457.1 hypothetical protein [Xanthomonas euroxanthea]